MPVGPLLSFVSERRTIGRQAQVYDLGSLLRLVNVGIASDVTYENDLVDGAARLILPRKFLGLPVVSFWACPWAGSVELGPLATSLEWDDGRCRAGWGRGIAEWDSRRRSG